MRRLGDVLPSVASELGLDDQLRQARAMSSWERIVEEHVPQAVGASSMLAIRPPSLLVSATSPIVAQELRLRADELLRRVRRVPGRHSAARIARLDPTRRRSKRGLCRLRTAGRP